MIAQWRLFLLALRYFTRIPVPPWVIRGKTRVDSAARFLPLVGAVVGAAGGAAYWGAAAFWPTSVAVVLSMLATMLITGAVHELGLADTCCLLSSAKPAEKPPDAKAANRLGSFGMLIVVFFLFTKYNALMALSAASLVFALPPTIGLGVIMIAAHTASRALVVTAIAIQTPAPHGREAARPHVSVGELCFALLTGFLPATLLGTAGLIGLAAAIVIRIAFVPYVKKYLGGYAADYLGATQQLTEVGFYLGALAAWTYF
ncbi:MAG: adenosylcobinamide-GDP ribazoletransferase [Steroidobacteraceae bacterium]|jgi:adenosylcobinamide-GDP ribazoletransferase